MDRITTNKEERSYVMIDQAIRNAFKKRKERGWDKTYWAIDVHDTILLGEYSSDQTFNPHPDAVKVLKWLSSREDMVIIIWTSSYAKDYQRLKDWFLENHGVKFDYHNENPECGSTDYAEFTTKFYFNILIDDKAGFDINTDWGIAHQTLRSISLTEYFNKTSTLERKI